MKSFMRHVPLAGLRTMGGKGLQLALIFGLALFAAGCGKKETPPPATNTPPAPQSAAPLTPVPSQTNPVAVPGADADLTVIQRLNQAAIGFRMQKQRYPGTVEELAAFAGIQLPAPPPGKKYAFSGRGLVILVDNSTK
jgi:hypothetical protein